MRFFDFLLSSEIQLKYNYKNIKWKIGRFPSDKSIQLTECWSSEFWRKQMGWSRERKKIREVKMEREEWKRKRERKSYVSARLHAYIRALWRDGKDVRNRFHLFLLFCLTIFYDSPCSTIIFAPTTSNLPRVFQIKYIYSQLLISMIFEWCEIAASNPALIS